MPSIDTTTYPKTTTYPVNHGYSVRSRPPTSIVVHSTNNPNKNTPFANEATYLFESDNVTADFLVGKDGRIVQFLDSARFYGWHAGGQRTDGTWTAKPDYANPRSIGIELHHSIGDGSYPAVQVAALTWLVRLLMARFAIVIGLIDTHRKIALPAGRKVDPSDWSDADFYRWRASLTPAPPPSAVGFYVALAPMWISETPTPRGPIALQGKAVVEQGEVLDIDEVKNDFGHLRSGVGFLPIGGLRKT
jgi:N-acetyl-anhydromuramyl-L-alanine amidase AmpD